MTSKTSKLLERYYTSRMGWVNGTLEFHRFIAKHGNLVGKQALELGAGPSNKTSEFLSSRAEILYGLDIDFDVQKNIFLDQAMTYDGRRFPLEDESFDVVVADYVMEHVEYPTDVVCEISRVLKPGGRFIFRAPNRWHYVTIISALTPHSYHLRIANPVRDRSEKDTDPYPAYYRFSTRRSIYRTAVSSEMKVIRLDMVEKEPSYLKFNGFAFRLGVAYERIVNSTTLLKSFRANFFGILEKPH